MKILFVLLWLFPMLAYGDYSCVARSVIGKAYRAQDKTEASARVKALELCEASSFRCYPGVCKNLETNKVAGILPFELPQMNGEGGMFESQEHMVYVIEAYFLDCPYCNDNAPAVNELASSFANEPRVLVLDVGRDKGDSQYAEWIRRHEPNHPVLKDSSQSLLRRIGVQGYPTTVVVSCSGEIEFRTSGEWSNSTQRKLSAAIQKAVDQCASPSPEF